MPKLKKEKAPSEIIDLVLEEESLPSATEMLAESMTEELATPEDSVTILKQKIEQLPLEKGMAPQVSRKVNDAQDLEDEEKIQYVLKLAKTKGVVFAIKVAQKMNDPYILDSVHDALIEDGYYQKFE